MLVKELREGLEAPEYTGGGHGGKFGGPISAQREVVRLVHGTGHGLRVILAGLNNLQTLDPCLSLEQIRLEVGEVTILVELPWDEVAGEDPSQGSGNTTLHYLPAVKGVEGHESSGIRQLLVHDILSMGIILGAGDFRRRGPAYKSTIVSYLNVLVQIQGRATLGVRLRSRP
jgi:hypothetical protein